MYSTLISASELHSQLTQKSVSWAASWVIVDCRFDLARPDAGRTAYRAGHIHGAVYAHLEEDLSAPKTAQSGRHPLPDPAQLATKLGAWGIDRHSQVIAYDADNGAHAARLWWLLRWLGHEAVAVLDGGFKCWQAAGYPVDQASPRLIGRLFQAQLRSNFFVGAEEVAQRVTQPDWRVLDARAPERYAGTVEPIDPIAGHIPGAHNYPFARNLSADARFLPAADLRTRFEQALGEVNSHHAIAMCGSGVTACHNLLAMEVAGLSGARLYAGSWSEWIRDPNRPIATGDHP